MSSIEAIIEPRARDLGGFWVNRILPAPRHRMVGPFIFLDEMGPARFAPGNGIDVRPHPHIGLATVTYLFEGAILHRDSLGSERVIRPGDVNWMTAGRGIAHSERTPREERAAGHALHGLQSWVALPAADEEAEPSFHHHPAAALPEFRLRDVTLRLIAGTAYGKRSPVETFSELFYVHADLADGARLAMPDEHEGRALYLLAGSLDAGGERIEPQHLVIFRAGAAAPVTALAPSRAMLLGGAAIGERHIWWNFVHSRRERIEEAKRDWIAGRFGKVPGDEAEFIPLPQEERPSGTVM